MTTGIRAAMAAGAVVLTAGAPAWAGDDATRLSVRPATTLAAVLIEALREFAAFYGPDLMAEYPTGSGVKVSRTGAVGVDEPMWSPAFADAAVPGLIRRASIQTLEFNGGGVSDLYHWKTGTAQADPDPDGHPDYASLPQVGRPTRAAGWTDPS